MDGDLAHCSGEASAGYCDVAAAPLTVSRGILVAHLNGWRRYLDFEPFRRLDEIVGWLRRGAPRAGRADEVVLDPAAALADLRAIATQVGARARRCFVENDGGHMCAHCARMAPGEHFTFSAAHHNEVRTLRAAATVYETLADVVALAERELATNQRYADS